MTESQQINPEDMDDGLRDLLDHLDEIEPDMEPVAKPGKPPVKAPPKKSDESELPGAHQQVIQAGDQSLSSVPKRDDAPGGAVSASASSLADQLLDRFGKLQGEIWAKQQEDRASIDKYLGMFEDRIADPEQVKVCYVEAIAALLSTKATGSMNATKLLDSMAKMVAAIKTMTDTGGGGEVDLSKMLGESPNDEFDPNEP